MNLSTYTTEQLNLLLLTLEGVERQLDELSPVHLSEEDKKQQETLMQQAYALEEQVTLETARRSIVCLQAEVSDLTLHGKDAITQIMAGLSGLPNCPDESKEKSTASIEH